MHARSDPLRRKPVSSREVLCLRVKAWEREIALRDDHGIRPSAPIDGELRVVEPDPGVMVGRVIVRDLIGEQRIRLGGHEAMGEADRDEES
jgi:hypothetical protein